MGDITVAPGAWIEHGAVLNAFGGSIRLGRDVFLGDIWPTSDEIYKLMKHAMNGKAFRKNYDKVKSDPGKLWQKIKGVKGNVYSWPKSTYIAEPPFFGGNFGMSAGTAKDVKGARALGLFGDSVTTDHISPAGAIKADSPAGRYLSEHGVTPKDFNSYGSRRGNHEIMIRGTFANIRLRNQLVPGVEGGFTVDFTTGEQSTIYDAAQNYAAAGVPLVVLSGKEYGSGSSRDWAAKGTALLGVKVVIAESYERIHRSNLIGMGVLPLQFPEGENADSLGLTGEETFTFTGIEELNDGTTPKTVHVKADDIEFDAIVRIDTPGEADYYRNGGIMQYVLRSLLAS